MRVLLVDDSPVFLTIVSELLNLEPEMEIVGQACSGYEALEQVALLNPDLVLMDLSMPGMDGLEATRRLKARPNPPCVIILTLDDNAQYRDAATQSLADGFLSKAECANGQPCLLAQMAVKICHPQHNGCACDDRHTLKDVKQE